MSATAKAESSREFHLDQKYGAVGFTYDLFCGFLERSADDLEAKEYHFDNLYISTAEAEYLLRKYKREHKCTRENHLYGCRVDGEKIIFPVNFSPRGWGF